MDDNQMPTVIWKSIKEFNKILKEESAPYSSKSNPRQKLNFSDVDGDIFNDSRGNEESNSLSSQFMKKHQDNIAGLVIAKNINEKNSELLEAKATISAYESKLNNMQTFFKKYRIDHEKEIEKMRSERTKDMEKVRDMSNKLQKYQSNEASMKEQIVLTKKQLTESSTKWEEKFLSLQKTNSEKIDEILNESSNLRDKVVYLEKSLSEKLNKVNDLELRNVDLEESNKSLRSRIVGELESRLEIEKLQLKLSQTENKNKELEARLAELKERDDQVRMFDNAMTEIPSLRKQMSKLKEENHSYRLSRVNAELLEEKLSSTEAHIKVLENRCNEIISENGTLRALTKLMEGYELAIKKEFEVDYLPPIAEFTSMLQSMRKKEQDVDHSISELTANVKCHGVSIEDLETENKNLKEELTKRKGEVDKTSQIINRLQRKTVLLSKERDNLKDILSSYETESTVMLSAVERQRVTRLESQLQDYKLEISKLETELNAFQSPTSNREQLSHSLLPKDHDSAKLVKEIEELKTRVEELIEEKELLKDELEKHGFQGGFDPRKTKVLNFEDNPLEKANQERAKHLETLSRENESLKKRIKLLSEGEKEDLTAKVGMKVGEDSSERVKELEKKVGSLEQRNDKIIDSFKKKSQEMREIVYRLLGYRIDFMDNNNYRLSSLFSESKDDFLMFEQTNEGVLQLLETDFSDTLEVLIETYLHQDDSYPLFLSALTLDLHKRQADENYSSSSSEIDEGNEDLEGREEDEDDLEEEVAKDDEGDQEEYEGDYEENVAPAEEGDEEEEGENGRPGVLDEEIEEDDDLEYGREEDDIDDDESEMEDLEEEFDEEDDDYEEPPTKRSKTQVEEDDSDDDLICLD